jgi:uncharacterized protein YjbI with pentapeptide repeats
LIISHVNLSVIVSQGDFSYADLSDAVLKPMPDTSSFAPEPYPLERITLTSANFRGAEIFSVSFAYASLAGSSFDNASIINARFENAVLDSATFTGAKIFSARFVSADLDGADFSGATFLGVNFYEPDFSSSNMEGVTFNHSTIVDDRPREWTADARQLCRAKLIRQTEMPAALVREMQRDQACARKLVGVTAVG